MKTQAAFSARPGTIFNHRGVPHVVLENDTMQQILTVHIADTDRLKDPNIRLHYTAGSQLDLVDRPYRRARSTD